MEQQFWLQSGPEMLFRGSASPFEFFLSNLFRAFISSVDIESIFAIIWIICPVCGRPGWVFCQLFLPVPILTFRIESKYFFDQLPELSILKDGILENQVKKKTNHHPLPLRPGCSWPPLSPQAFLWDVLVAAEVAASPPAVPMKPSSSPAHLLEKREHTDIHRNLLKAYSLPFPS